LSNELGMQHEGDKDLRSHSKIKVLIYA
ncbi:MAG: hypothetical protein RLY91_2174, partial [Pseudomonadota bacterium]